MCYDSFLYLLLLLMFLRNYFTADERLFNQILLNETHTLNNLLPPLSEASQHYNLRQRGHSLELPNKTVHLTCTITSFSECSI